MIDTWIWIIKLNLKKYSLLSQGQSSINRELRENIRLGEFTVGLFSSGCYNVWGGYENKWTFFWTEVMS